MNFRIGPAVGQVRFVGIEENQPAFTKQSEASRRFPVMLVYFREPVGKIVNLMVNFVLKRDLYEFFIGKNLSDHLSEVLVQTIIVINVEKTPVIEIIPQVRCLRLVQAYGSVAGQ